MPTLNEYTFYLLSQDVYLMALVILCVWVVFGGAWVRLRLRWLNPDMSIRLIYWYHRPMLYLPRPTLSWLSIGFILLLGLLLRVPKLFDPMWFDETFTARIASLPFHQAQIAISADVHPPLFYDLIWLWNWIGSPISLRVPSLIFGVITIYLVYRLALNLKAGQAAATLAALLCAIAPGAIYYSGELRSYALLTMAVIGASVALTEKRFLLFFLMIMFTAWSHYIGLVYAGLIILLAVWRHRDFAWFLALLSAVPVVALVMLQGGAADVADGYWMDFNWAMIVRPLTLPLLYVPPQFVGLLIPYLLMIFSSLWVARRWLVSRGTIVGIIIIAVPLMVGVVSFVWQPVFVARAFLPCALLLLIPLAILLDRHRKLFAVAIPVFGVALWSLYSFPMERVDYAAGLERGCSESTAAYYLDINTAFTIDHYWDKPAFVWEQAQDFNEVITPAEVELFGFQLGQLARLEGQTVCIPVGDTPRVTATQRAFLETLKFTYPHSSYTLTVRPYFDMVYYQFEL